MALKTTAPSRNDAETLALTAVAVILGDDDLRDRFLAVTGTDADAMRDALVEPAFLAAVLDFVLEADDTVHLVAETAGIAPGTVGLCRAALPGGGMDWTG